MKKIILSIIAIISLACCSQKKEDNPAPTITVTIEPLRYFTQGIAGDKFNVVSMVPEGSSPETYDPTPQQLVNLGKSKAYLRIGYIGFEQVWMKKLMDNNPNLKVFDTSHGVALIHEAEDEHEHHEGHHHEGGIDPHLWNSTTNAAIISDNIFKALCQLAPNDKEYFAHRLDSMKSIYSDVDSQIKGMLVNADTTFMIYHPALSYYAREYGLKQISIEEDGKEPTPTSLKRLIDTCKEQKPHVIFVQKEFDTRNAELISNELGLKIIVINPLSFDWKSEMLEPAKALRKYE